MRKLIVSTWMSLDGVFDAEFMNQWFAPFDSKERQDYIRDGIQACDALMFGRTTYEMLAPYWSAQKNNEMGVAAKLNSAPKYVISSSLKKADWENSTVISKNVIEEITRLKQQPGSEIQIEGSAVLVNTLMKAGLIDEFRFLVHPVIMGRGIRFFKEDMPFTGLKLLSSKRMEKDVMLLCYQTIK